jgi:ribosomal subunit interface protein
MRTIDFRAKGFEITAAMRQHVDRRCAFALARFGDDLARVQLSVEDLNGPRGGADMHVGLLVRSRRTGELRVHAVDADFYAAIDRVVERAARALDRARARGLDVRRATRALTETGWPVRSR